MSISTLTDFIADSSHITVLTGAGVSAASGVPLWRPDGTQARSVGSRSVEEISSATTWRKSPQVTWDYYLGLTESVAEKEPNAAHRSIADLETSYRTVEVFTQNIDDFHERAGSSVVHHFHGGGGRFVCTFCDNVYTLADLDRQTRLAKFCECGARVRPDVVLFGESLPSGPVDRIERILKRKSTDLILVVGTSLKVSPVSMIPLQAMDRSIPVWEINPQPTEFAAMFSGFIRGNAERILPRLLG